MPVNRPLIILVLLLAVGLISIRQWGPNDIESVRRSRIIMGTVVEITAFGTDKNRLEEAVTAAFKEMGRIEKLMSASVEGSDIDRVSKASAPQEVSPETLEVTRLGRTIAEATEGAFDMTLGRLIHLWGIGTDAQRLPAAQEVQSALAGSGPKALSVQGTQLVKSDPHLHIDLGAIAKGYAADRAVEVLRQGAITSATINAGGDLHLLGRHQDRSWRIGIQHPRHTGELLATLILEDTAVVTSGDYERFFMKDGVRYHHLFDPKTGYPARACQSVTVVAPTAALADALATALFVLGPERGLEVLKQFPGTDALIVDAQGEKVISEGLKERIEWP